MLAIRIDLDLLGARGKGIYRFATFRNGLIDEERVDVVSEGSFIFKRTQM